MKRCLLKRWYVAHTLPRGEETALINLQRQGFDVFLPKYHKVRRHARKTDVILAPLFPSYLFVAIDIEVDRWFSINATRGISYLVRQHSGPTAVPDGIVEALKMSADVQEVVPLSSLSLFQPGEKLEILEGAFVGHTGIYEKMTDNERVQLLLEMLGRPVKVAVPIHAVTAVA